MVVVFFLLTGLFLIKQCEGQDGVLQCDNCLDTDHGYGCNNAAIQSCVCAINLDCCSKDWDSQCVSAVTYPEKCNYTCAEELYCDRLSVQSKKGCSNKRVESCVCELDPTCCNKEWDFFCVGLVQRVEWCRRGGSYNRIIVCGDSIKDAGEECDDGANGNDTDGCRDNCTIPRCGDSIKDDGEECDDGANGNDTDGCRDICIIPQEPNWTTDISYNKTCNSTCQNQFGRKPLATYKEPSGEEYHVCAANTNNHGIRGGSLWGTDVGQNKCFTSCCPYDDCTEQTHYRCLCETNGLKWVRSYSADCDMICKEDGMGGAVISGINVGPFWYKGMEFYVCRMNVSGILVGGHTTGRTASYNHDIMCHAAKPKTNCHYYEKDFECLCKK